VEEGRLRRPALVARTATSARRIMIEGPAGLLACSPPWCMPRWESSKAEMRWPNGAVATVYHSKEPDVLRGGEHDGAWCDEPASWYYPVDTWDNLAFSLRTGDRPRVVATTTPKPIPLVRRLLAEAGHVTRGATRENEENLSPAFLTAMRRYEGTRLGRQELEAELLEDRPGALWRRGKVGEKGTLEGDRVSAAPSPLARIVVAVDPPAAETPSEETAECGIVAAGIDTGRLDVAHAFVLDDRSMQGSPNAWATQAVAAYQTLRADRIVAEANQGGAMVASTIRAVAPNVPVTLVHASRGKQARAEPVAALYEQGRVHHVGFFAELEDQLCEWEPGLGLPSPDRLDALVQAMTDLLLGEEPPPPPAGRWAPELLEGLERPSPWR
jgi:phage terminase large subunit-like protein